MKGLSGVLIFSVGGALLIVALVFAISAGWSGMLDAAFVYGVLFGFTAFFFIGMGVSLILHGVKSTKDEPV